MCARKMPAVRLIPARAGKTPNSRWTARRSRAHPRAGGENLPTVNAWPTASGSSPRGRGKQQADDFNLLRQGLIPARAGKT